MSDANRLLVKYAEESVWGVPESTPAMQVVRLTSESFGQEQQSTTSQELRSDRQVSDLIQTGVSGAGDLNIEWSSDTYDDFLEWALQSAGWTTPIAAYDAVSAAIANVTGNVWSVSKAAIDSTISAAFIGKWFLLASSSHSAMNGPVKILSVATGVLQVLGFQLSAATLTGTATLTEMSQIVNGTTFSSCTIQKQFVDLTNTYNLYPGSTPAGFNLAVAPDAVTTGAFNFLCKTEESATSDMAGSTVAATTTPVWNGISNVFAVYDQRAVLPVTAVTTTLNNNLRARLQIGTLGAISIGSGTVDVNGTFAGYFSSQTQMAKFRSNSATSFTVIFKDAQGKYYIFDMPQVKFSIGKTVATGINTDVLQELSYTAYLSPSELITLRIAKSA